MGLYRDLQLTFRSNCNHVCETKPPAGIAKRRITMRRVAEAEPIVKGEPELVD